MSNNQTISLTNATLLEQLQWLKANAESDGTYNITITADENIGVKTLSFPSKSNIVLRLVTGDGAGEKVISLVGNGSLFTIEAGVTLILEDGVILQGHGKNTDSLVSMNGGVLIMNAGAAIRNNFSTCFYGGGVQVNPKGELTMNGGQIFGNSVSGSGGGVSVECGGRFTMMGGQIFGNTAGLSGGGVTINHGNFVMESGDILGNIAIGNGNSDGGGGVFLCGGKFTMIGGKIFNNRANDSGGGVSVAKYGEFIMTGGEIIRNSTAGFGGGISVWKGTFNRSSGNISGNSASTGDDIYE